MAALTPTLWRARTLGKSYDTDKAYGNQCWDYLDIFFKENNIPVSTHCSLTGYVEDLWKLKDKYGYSQYFDYIYDASDLRDGDWCFWAQGSSHPYSHVAMYYEGLELGQNQGFPYVTEKETTWDIMGALRWKGWLEPIDIPYGQFELELNGRHYSLYRQNPEEEEATVLAAGINKLCAIDKFAAGDKEIRSISTGANFYQMKTDQKDPYGTTYGDVSSPINQVWTELPHQDTTLYFDVTTGAYADCTGFHVPMDHPVFSPAVVYPSAGNFQYARMVGINHVNIVSRYTFVIRLNDGTYINGLALEDGTPKQIASDLKRINNLSSIAFLDGGGSAQFGVRDKETHALKFIRNTQRECPSAFTIISKASNILPPVIEPVVQPAVEEEPMPEIKDDIQPVPIPDWKDPEKDEVKTNETVLDSMLKRFFTVKSLVTIFITVIFGILALKGNISNEQFMSIFTMIISFFFGYSFEKKNNDGGGSK